MGHQCVAVTGSLADQDNTLLNKVRKLEPADTLEARGLNIKTPVHKVSVNGVTHFIAFSASSKVTDLLAVEETALKELYLNNFSQLEPDVLLNYGGLSSNFFAGFHAQAQGCRSVLYAGSPTYTKASHFIHVQKVFTPSNALREQMA